MSDMEAIDKKINEVANDHLDGLEDSLKHMDLVVSIEQAFEIELTLDEIIIMTSVVAIKRVLNDRGVLAEWN